MKISFLVRISHFFPLYTLSYLFFCFVVFLLSHPKVLNKFFLFFFFVFFFSLSYTRTAELYFRSPFFPPQLSLSLGSSFPNLHPPPQPPPDFNSDVLSPVSCVFCAITSTNLWKRKRRDLHRNRLMCLIIFSPPFFVPLTESPLESVFTTSCHYHSFFFL